MIQAIQLTLSEPRGGNLIYSASVKIKQTYLLIAIMAFIAIGIAGTSIFILYNVALDESRAQLVETAHSQARLIEAVARFDKQFLSSTYPGGSFEATISQIREAHENFKGFGQTGEFVLAKREGDEIIFLLSHRHHDLNQPHPVSFNGKEAVPMRRALQGKSGIMIGSDYRGEMVLAAYEPVAELALGIVAKIDMAEVRAPFFRAGLIVGGLAACLIVLGAWLFASITRPMIRQVEESEERFRRAIVDAPIPIMIHADDGMVLQVNKAWTKLTGYTHSDIPTISEWTAKAYGQKMDDIRAAIDDLYEQNTLAHKGESTINTKTGEPRMWDFSSGPLGRLSDGRRAVISLAMDVTERKGAEEKIRTLSLSVEQANELIMITDLNGIIEYVNPAFSRTTGYSEEEAIGQNPRMLKSGQQDKDFYLEMWDVIKSGQSWQGRVVDRKKDGSLYPAMLTVSPIYNEAGEITNYVGSQQDLSVYEELERKFHQAQKMEAVGTLVGGIAHEFNNTLAGITGNLYLAKQKASQTPDVVEKLEVIEKLSFRSAELIKALLSFARKGIVQKAPIPLNLFLKENIKLYRASLPESINLDSDIETRSVTINGDASLLQQAMLNIINNARDALYEAENPSVSIKLREFSAYSEFLDAHPECKSGNYACISISDNGIGIKSDDIPHIFEPFYTTKGVGKGTGLGLAMAYGTMQTHGGAIEIETAEEVGTLVRIYLPLLELDTEEHLLEEEVTIAHGQGETLLLVDDNSNVLASGKDVLENLNYKVLTALNGQEAIDIFKANRGIVDLVLIDVIMPVMGGIDAVERLHEIDPELKVIFATGYNRDNMRKSDKMDSETIISKPFKIHDLSNILRSKLDQR
jgi:PAS domain S-box-containing protein